MWCSSNLHNFINPGSFVSKADQPQIQEGEVLWLTGALMFPAVASVISGFSVHPDRHFPYLNLGIFFHSKTIYVL